MNISLSRVTAVTWMAVCTICLNTGAEAASLPPKVAVKPNCTYPDPYKVLGRDIPGVEKVEFQSLAGARAEDLRWLFISTDGPPDGSVYVIGCNGHTVASLTLGYVRQTKPGPLVEGRDTLEIIYVPASGSGIQVESVTLLQFDGTSIKKLWDHDSHNVAAFSHALFGGPRNDNRLMVQTYHYDWQYARSGSEITVSGTETDELGGRTKRRPLPREKFCYDKEKGRFGACR